MRRFTLSLGALTLFLFSVIALQAQTTTGRLTGNVAGTDGAVIPGATVIVTDDKTGKALNSVTNGEGGFSFPLLDFGAYTVKVSSKGFKTTVTTIKIEVGQQYSLNVVLQVGEVSENVTVTAGSDIINSSNAELSSTISNRQITELPLAARNPLALILTQAGSASNPSQNTSINGGRTSSTNVTRDGVNIQDNFIRSNATDFSPGRPSVDNVEEFTLSSQSAVDAGFGAAQVNFVTPRGGNQFHGAVWEYNRNSRFGANTWFNNAGGNYVATDSVVVSGFRRAGEEKVPRPFRNRNQYGFKVSGPILKNKLFFFVFGERLKDIVTASKLITVLTPTARAGVFRYSSGATTYSVNIFTPGAFTVGNSGVPVPTALNAAVNTRYLAPMAVGNSFEVGDGLNTMGYRYSQHGDQKRDSITGRVDYDLNAKNNINVVYDYNFEKNLRNDLDTVNVIPVVLQPARNVLVSGGWRYSPTASLSNELRIGRIFSVPEFLRTDAAASEFYTPTLITSPEPQNNGVFRNQGRKVKTLNFQDTASWVRGDHSIRFGGQFQSVKIEAFNDAGNLPVYTFGLSGNGPVLQSAVLSTAAGSPALSTAQQTTARNLFALLGGVLGAGQQTFNVTSQTSGFVPGATSLRQYSFKLYAPYVLDQWKISPTVTLNFGLRYDYQTALRGDNGLWWEPVIAEGRDPVQAALDPAGTFQFIGGNAGKPNRFYKPDKNNWAPSFGIAWAPRDIQNKFLKMITGENFVVRFGYRKSYVNDELVRAPDNALANHPGFSSALAALFGSSSAIDDRLGAAHTSTGLSPAPTFLSTRSYTTNNTASFTNIGTVFAIDPNLKTPAQQDYQLGIQRQFGNWVFEARYVGGKSNNVLRTIDYNQLTIPTAYRSDFNIVRTNLLAGCATTAACAAGTTLISTFGNAGNILPTNANGNLVLTGQIAELAWQQLIAGATNGIPNPNVVPYPTGTVRAQFLPNPNAGVVNVLANGGRYIYHSGQFELRRNFRNGLYLQGNYTWSKELSDAVGTGQTRVEPFLDNNNRRLDYTRADYDQSHVINVNAIYELPFGKGRRFLNSNKVLDYIIGGWQLGTVIRIGTGAPITFTDARGTLNRSGRSGRQTAFTTASEAQLKGLIGVYRTPCGIYFINPTALNINQANLQAGNCSALNTGVPTGTVGGAGSSGFGQPTFAGQVFFNNGPGTTGNLRRAVVNGPWFASADLSLLKNVRITERVGVELRAEAYNFTNTPFFTPGQFPDINSTTFGKITGVSVGARVMQFAARIKF